MGLSGLGGMSGLSGLLPAVGGAPSLPTPFAAYSVKKRVVTGYSGPLFRVIRSSDNTTQDIGFNGAGQLDETALLAFCGGGNGIIEVLYDQSGNARHMARTYSYSSIFVVFSGSITRLSNGDPGGYFDGYNSFMQWFGAVPLSTLSFYTALQVWDYNPAGAANKVRGMVLFAPPAGQLDWCSKNALLLFHNTTPNVAVLCGADYFADGTGLTEGLYHDVPTGSTIRQVYGFNANSGASELRLNGLAHSSDTHTPNMGSAGGILLGARSGDRTGVVEPGSGAAAMIFCSLMVYTSNTAAQAAAIEALL
jgi:hypothetical protein